MVWIRALRAPSSCAMSCDVVTSPRAALAALRERRASFRRAAPEIRARRDLVLEAVAINGDALEFAAAALQVRAAEPGARARARACRVFTVCRVF